MTYITVPKVGYLSLRDLDKCPS